MKKHQKQIFALAVIFVFTATMLLLTELSEAGKSKKAGPNNAIMTMLDEIYDIVLDTNSKIEPCEPEIVVGVPKTGQTICYDTDGSIIECAGTGQDGEYQYGTPFPEPRFTDNEDGTVTDNMTGLMWTIDAQQISGLMTWEDAIEECNGLEFAGWDDWRMPNVREMLSLIDYGYSQPALTPNHPFTNVESYPGVYWSSTAYAGSDDVFHVPISNGTVGHVGKDGSKYVWPVRGGD